MIKVKDNKATREPLPTFLRGLSPESLADLSWTDPALGVSDSAWWPVRHDRPELASGYKLGEEILTADAESKTVIVSYAVVAKSEEDIALEREELASRIAERRYIAEVSGVTINGMRVDTGDRAKLLINGAAVEAMIDPDYVMQWKAGEGFVELTGAQVIGIARAVRAHVQACFDREADLLAALDAGTIAAEMIDQGWPVA